MTVDDLPGAQGVLRVRDDERGERAYALGSRTQLDGDAPMLDWRTAPLGEAFFRYRPGERYELELGDDRVVAGRVVAAYLVAEGQQLAGAAPVFPPEDPGGARGPWGRGLPVLDPEQQAAVDLDAGTSLVLDGEAGVGKTLVALYRVAALARQAEGQRTFRALVLVPTEGLRRLVGILAERLEIARVEIAVFDDWLLARARAAFPGLPKHTSSGATAQVIGLKRHPAVRVVAEDFVGWKPPRGADDEKISRTRQRLLHLFGDRDRLQRIVDAAGGELPSRAIDATMKHTRAQFESTTERSHRHVDADRLVALDGRALDSGTPMEDAHTFDLEDVPVLFELVRRGALPAAKLPVYDHVVVDEAQLRAPLELACVADALGGRGTATLAGDHRQATDESAWFTSWATARAELGRARWRETTLAVTYRSVPAIATFARSVSEGRPMLPADAGDPAIQTTCTPHALAQAALLCWHLGTLLARDPWREICVVARTPEHARRLHAELSRGLDPVLVLDGDFRFEPGIVVTFAAAISGLEFDAVVIPDLSPDFYPRTPELARALYVACTRARDWLWLLTPSTWSPLVA